MDKRAPGVLSTTRVAAPYDVTDPVRSTFDRRDFYLIGDAAALTGITAHALRAWERVGLVAPRRSAAGVRQYTRDDLARIRLIARTLNDTRLSRHALAALLDAGELRPDVSDYVTGSELGGPAGERGPEHAKKPTHTDSSAALMGQRESRLLDAVARVGTAVASGRDLDDVLTTICRETCRAFAVADAVVWLLERLYAVTGVETIAKGRISSDLVLAAGFGRHVQRVLRSDQPSRVRLTGTRGLFSRMLRTPEVIRVNALDAFEMTHPDLAHLLPAAALLLVPLISSTGETIGVLALREALNADRLNEVDLRHAQMFANQAAIAIQTARLHDEIRASKRHAEAEQARWQAAMEHAPQFVVICDASLRITYCNPTYERMIGRLPSSDAHLGATSEDLESTDRDIFESSQTDKLPLARALSENRAVHGVEIMQRAVDGSMRFIAWDAAPMRTRDGELLGVVAEGRDMTVERRQMQRETCLAAVARAAAGRPGPGGIEERCSRVIAAFVESAGLPVESATLYLRDTESGEVQSIGVIGTRSAGSVSHQMRADSPHAWHPLMFEPQYSELDEIPPPWCDHVQPEIWKSTGIHSWALVPLRTGGEVLGALAVGFGVVHSWDVAERAWIEACAGAVALALENDRLFSAELRRTRELEAVLDGVTDGITMVSADGKMLVRNAVAAALTARNEVGAAVSTEAHDYMLRDAATRQPVPLEETPVMRALRGESVRDSVLMIRDGNGNDRIMVSSANPVRDATGQVVGAATIFHELTGQWRLARLFERLGQQLGATLQPADEMQVLADALIEVGGLDTVAVYTTNEDRSSLHLVAARNYPAEVIRSVANMPAHAPTIAGLALRTAEAQVAASFDTFQGPDHSLTRVLVEQLHIASGVALPLLARGRVVGVLMLGAKRVDAFPPDEVAMFQALAARVGLAVDNADLFQSARRTAAELNAIINAIADGVWTYDMSGRLTRANHAAIALMEGLIQLDAPTRGTYGSEAGTDADTVAIPLAKDSLRHALKGEITNATEERVYSTSTGTERWLSASYAPIRDEAGGTVVGAVAVGRDITALKQMERMREDFLAVVAHELRTPLTSMLGFVQAARRLRARGMTEQARVSEGGQPRMQADLLARIERQALRLDRLVGDLLDVVRINQGRLQYRWITGDVAGAVAEALDEQRASHPDRHIIARLPHDALLVRMDPDRISQAVTNLLTNALKYSRVESPVVVEVGMDPDGLEGPEAVVRVEDAGPGIPQEHMAHLFERFYRVPGVDVQSGSGIGLGVGLHLAREIVVRHGGRIWVESQPRKGSTFIFTVPLLRDSGQ